MTGQLTERLCDHGLRTAEIMSLGATKLALAVAIDWTDESERMSGEGGQSCATTKNLGLAVC